MTNAERGFFYVMDCVVEYGTETDILAEAYEEKIDKNEGPAVVKKKSKQR